MAIKLFLTQAQQNQPPESISRCKTASEDKAHDWKNVSNEVTTRLQIAHSTWMVFLMIVMGWKCMVPYGKRFLSLDFFWSRGNGMSVIVNTQIVLDVEDRIFR